MTDTAKDAHVVTLVSKIEGPPGADAAALAQRLVGLNMAGARTAGFWSGEIVAPEAHEHTWKLVQRFSTAGEAASWKESEARRKIVQELTGMNVTVSDDLTEDASSENAATAIVTDVKPGMEEQYFAWEAKIQNAQARSSGYRGAYLQPPAAGRLGQWSTLVHYDSPQSLEKWFACDERKQLLLEANNFVKATHFQKVATSFPGWFPTDADTGEPPPNWKTAMLVLLGLFPTVMLEIRFLSPQLTALNPAVASFTNLVISVLFTTWGTMPLFIKWFTWWLFPNKETKSATDIKGVLTMIGLFALEIALTWNLVGKK